MDTIERFVKAQEESYGQALMEIKNGRKRSHWMWYIFPQLKGLGRVKLPGITELRTGRKLRHIWCIHCWGCGCWRFPVNS